MSSIVYLKNKSSGKVYAYLNESVWNSTLKRCECKRKCLGHVDPVTGDIVPNKGQKKESVTSAFVNSFGLTYFLRGVSDGCGLTASIQAAFPNDWKLLLTCCFYLLDSDSPIMSRIVHWSKDNDTPYGKEITTEDITDLLSRIDENSMFRFFREWRDTMETDDFYMSHTTSVSSYDTRTETISFNDLPVMTIVPSTGISMVYSSKTGVPVTYSVWNKPPVDNIDLVRRVRDKSWLDLNKVTQILDREFCNDLNIDGLFRNGTRFVIRAPPEFYFAKDAIVRVKDRIMAMENLKIIGGEQLFVMSFLNYWKGRRCYTHIYFSADESEKEFSYFLGLIDDCRRELENNMRIREHESFYRKYFNVTDTKYGRIVEENGEAIMTYNDVAGFFVLVSNSIKSPVTALDLYMQKDKVQKNFENLRNEVDRTALKLYSDVEYDGRLFIHFLTLILRMQVKRTMRTNALLRDMTSVELFQEMKYIKKVSIPGFDTPFYTKVNNTQAEIMKTFGMDPGKLTSVVKS
ncbi:MAG: hypothetical protein PUK31_03195 [Candidatus Methanomethylophilaceae archaeon]|nr:hypothetical protein [Candidatus Methanomethylophilaceae archaeon]MDY5872385.1 hypothetical protein [Candidatus Methanomethylophilaceae archaeon]